MIQLKNNTKATSKIGFAVTVDPNDNQSFLYAVPSSTKVIGIVMESVPYRGICKIATLGDKAKVYVSGNVVKGDILRLSKTTDRASLGASVITKSGDAPYVRIGEALNSGRGLVGCVLDFNYLQSDGTTITWDDVTGKPVEFPPEAHTHDIYVPYAGATGAVDLGSEDLTTTGLLEGGSLKVDNPTLIVDKINHRVGIGEATPLGKLHVSQPATYGADLILNGGFDTGDNWLPEAGWTITGGKLVGAGTSTDVRQTPNPLTIGKTYRIIFTISDYAAGSVKVKSSAGSSTASFASDGTHTGILIADSTAFEFDGTVFNGKIDDVSCEETIGAAPDILVATSDGDVGIGTATPNSTMQMVGSVSHAYRAINAIRTLDATDYQIECTANTFTVTLPTAVGITGRVYSIKNTGTGVITVDGDGVETIDGDATQTLNQWDNMMIMSNGANWIII